jgi:hypothetical protein
MAIKRMFDKAVLDTEKFFDLPMSSKALYFLLGMEADDEGFVIPRKILKMHGGSDDDIKLLIAKELVIPFESGVVVITDWLTNNYLDKNRIKPTQHYQEKKQLSILNIGKNRNSSDKRYILTKDKERWLNIGLTDVKLEEYRREEKNRNVFDLEKDNDQEKQETLKKIKEIKKNLFT